MSGMRIHLMTEAEFAASGLAAGGRLLGVVGLGARRPPALQGDCPFVTADLPVVGGQPLLEVWEADSPVRYRAEREMRVAESDSALFGMTRVAGTLGRDLTPLARDIYEQIFAVMAAAEMPALLRIHNYIGGITQIVGGAERYRRFNTGRHEAFTARAKPVATAPAACALGTSDDALLVYFLASRGTVMPIENPRQLSAYRYPSRYGPQAPIFARAAISQDREAMLFLSGTASIVGHESLHPGDVVAQTEETLRNLRVLTAQCAAQGLQLRAGQLRLKTYLRDPADRDRVAAVLEAGQLGAEIVYLHADICRPELLVEVEGFAPLEPAGG
jgi:chorismate lyase / 3-hydroxybenzoate synthase